MATIDIFNDDAFGLVELTAALEDVDYLPDGLAAMNIFTEKSSRTESVAIERKDNTLVLVPTTPRGAAPVVNSVNPRNVRNFSGVRLAKSDRITASELAGVRAFGSDSEFVQVQQEVLGRLTDIRNDMELTHEHMRLGAVQGIVLDADGSELFNWFDAWDITQPAEISFDFTDLVDGKLREKTTQLIRLMARNSKGAWSPRAQVGALAGDEFYDALIKNKEVRDTYLGWSAAADLRASGMPWEPFPFGGIQWMNYRGTDDNQTVAIDPKKVKFFPIGAPGAFLRVNTPGEFLDTVNQPGQEYYALTIPDEKRNAYVDVELYSYPLYVATRPKMLLRGKLP